MELSQAVLPEPPGLWSYSSLQEVQTCPLRFALTRARYPDLWDRAGYPSPPSVHSLFGDVVHASVELVIKALTAAGVSSPASEMASSAIRSLGGLTRVIDTMMERQLFTLRSNPRMRQSQLERIERGLRDQTSLASVQVQTFLGRTPLLPGARREIGKSASPQNTPDNPRSALREGSYAEALLVADDLRLQGRIDLLTVGADGVTIVDFKTGDVSASHRSQLVHYALLWSLDKQSNPRSLPIAELRVAYRNFDLSADIPSPIELAELTVSLQEAIAKADAELGAGMPQANPNAANCNRCPVRQLCSPYWSEMAPMLDAVKEGDWFDFQGVIGEQNGQRSWWTRGMESGDKQLLIRTSGSDLPFAQGDRVRFIGLRRDAEPDTPTPVATFTTTTECFRLV